MMARLKLMSRIAGTRRSRMEMMKERLERKGRQMENYILIWGLVFARLLGC